MCAEKMHKDEVETDAALVRRLLAAQFPQWADLTIERVESSGTDNAIYRLGDEMAVRMPRIFWAVGQAETEQRWLPLLAPLLPLPIPVPFATGVPGEGYPWHWSVCPWMEGENATADRLNDLCEAANDLARFVRAMQAIDPAGGPAPRRTNAFRGAPLAAREPWTRDAIARLEGVIETEAATAEWETALELPAWEGAPVWIHGDLASGNLLAVDGRLAAVIDFGCLAAGDPAYDLIAAWTLFEGESREAFRTAVAVDDATWARGRGLAFSMALVGLPYYMDTNPVIVASARRVIAEILGAGASAM
jgi:aminoglycoside phosphotransferase (APT) family kinase protein